MRILHICTWYPDSENPHRALFIKRHIDALKDHCKNDVVHFEIIKSNFFGLQRKNDSDHKKVIIKLPFLIWRLNEVISFAWLFYTFAIKKNHKKYDLINFHIAYPLLSYWHWIKSKVSVPVLITEHWSAYHLNFGVSYELPRIQRIFRQKLPLICVSNALCNDIRNFSNADTKYYIVPNVIDSEIFYPGTEIKNDIFLMVGTWQKPKLPFLAMEAFLTFHKSMPNWKLQIIGEGPLFIDMKNWVSNHGVAKEIVLLGKKDPKEIAGYMRRARAFLHPSEYETFSVVCAEARACGLPVLASDKGGIPEAIASQGVLIDNDPKQWLEGLKRISEFSLAEEVQNPFDLRSVGKAYHNALVEIKNEAKR